MAFDTLSYARRLKAAGMPEAQAEAVADATHELIGARFATKDDLAALETRLTAALDTQSLRLTIRMGGLIAVGVAVLAALIKL